MKPARGMNPGDADHLVAALVSGKAPNSDEVITVWYAESAVGEREITVDQTNRSVIVGDRAVVKWLLHTDTAGHPAPARLQALVDAGFTAMPRPWGLLHQRDSKIGALKLSAIVTEYLPGTQDGWEWAVADVRTHVRGAESGALNAPIELGVLTAQMHVALSRTGISEATEAQAQSWYAAAGHDLAEAIDLVDGDEGARLRPLESRIKESLHPISECVGTPLIDVHGDFHVGQILRTNEPYAYHVTDFDGNPLQTAVERMQQQPAARDVAGMLASLDHVGRVVIHRTPDADAAKVVSWIAMAQEIFLDNYRDELKRANAEHLLDERLLGPFQVQQECREFVYSVKHLPHWRYVPDAALPALLDRLETPA